MNVHFLNKRMMSLDVGVGRYLRHWENAADLHLKKHSSAIYTTFCRRRPLNTLALTDLRFKGIGRRHFRPN